MLCDIVAQDLWLSIRLQCPAAQLLFTFDIKVSRDCAISRFRRTLFAYTLDLLSAHEKPIDYHECDLSLSKSLLFCRRVTMTSPKVSQRDCYNSLAKLEEERTIGDLFDFVDCGVQGVLEKGGERMIRTDLGREESSLWMRPEEIITKALTVRKVVVEDLCMRSALPKINESQGSARCVGCITF